MSWHQEFVAALFDADLPPPAGLTAWNASDPAARFAVYRNNVIVSLIDALADTYPVTQELVGEDFFRAMARLYIVEEPPRSRVLAFYGASFPIFIERFSPAASVPYLADVARLEIQRAYAYHSSDVDALSADMITQALVDIDRLPEMLVELHPSLELVRSQYAIVSLWAAHQGLADISDINPYVPETALVIRPQLDVEVISLNAGSSDFVSHLLRGGTLGAAVERVSLIYNNFDLTDILGLLIRSQAITSIYIPK